MLRKIGLALVVLSTLGAAAHGASAPNIQEGLWEITTEVKFPEIPNMPNIPGMQAMKVPTKHTQQQCLSNSKLIPDISPDKQKCSTSSTTTKGNTVIWNLECDDQGIISKGKGEITYKKTTFSGNFSMSIKNPNQPTVMQMTNTITGRRLGDCKQ